MGATAVSVLVFAGCTYEVAIHRDPTPTGAVPLQCVAVLPFDNLSGVEQAGTSVAQDLADELLLSNRFSVLEPLEARRLLEAMGFSGGSYADQEKARQYGRALGVEGIIVGAVSSYLRRQDRTAETYDDPLVSYSFRLIEVASGRVLSAGEVSATENDTLLALPQSRGRISRSSARLAAAELVQGRPDRFTRREICWLPALKVLEAQKQRLRGDEFDVERYALYVARGGETIVDVAREVLLRADQVKLILEANPQHQRDELLTRGARILVPRYTEHVTGARDTLADLATHQLGHPAYSTLIYLANRDLLEGFVSTGKDVRYGVVVDARQRWSLFDAVGSVADLFVVVNGVPRVFPHAEVRLRWLLYGRKLPSAKDQLEETFFEVAAELPEFLKMWRIEIRREDGAVERIIWGEGPPPAKVTWDRQLIGGKELRSATVYHYQLFVTYADGTEVASPIEAFGVDRRAEAPEVPTSASVGGKELVVTNDRFTERFSTEHFIGSLEVNLVRSDGALGRGRFYVPRVAIVKPTALEMLEVGVANEVYAFPAVPVVDGRFDLSQLDAVEIQFKLTGRTDPQNEIILDGRVLTVDAMGTFTDQLALRRDRNLFSLLARGPDGSQTFLEEEIVLRTRGSEGEAWEFAPGRGGAPTITAHEPLRSGMKLKIPQLRVPMTKQPRISDAIFEAPPVELEPRGTPPAGPEAGAGAPLPTSDASRPTVPPPGVAAPASP